MRANMKWIMILTAVTFVGLMVFGWGMDITGRSGSNATGGEIGRVNGEPVTYQEWTLAVRNLQEQQQRGASGPLGAAMNKQIEQAAWDQLVMQKLVNQELKARGINVSSDEIREAAMYQPPQEFYDNPAFQTDGRFDLNKYHQVMAAQGGNDQLLGQLEAYYREIIPRAKLYEQATTGAYLSDGDLWRMFKDAHESVKIRYIFFDPTTLIADNRVSVDERDIDKYYKEHKADYERPAHAKVKFIAIDRAPNAADTAAALAKAKEVRQKLLAGGDFAALAKTESSDSVSAADSGKVGKIKKGASNMVPAFEAAAFATPVGQISEPILTQFGYHLVKVTSRTGDEADVRHILIPINLSEDHDAALLERADSMEQVGSTLKLDEAGKRLGIPVRTADVEPSFAFLPGVGQIDEGSAWLFDDQPPVGEVSDVLESPTAYYMMEVVEKTEAGTLTLAEATPSIRAKLAQDKKLADAREVARKAMDALKAGKTLDEAAASVNLKVQDAGPFTRMDFVPGLGRANAAIGTGFGLEKGQTSGIVEAEGALFIIQTVDKTEPTRAEFEAQKEAQQGRIGQLLAQQRWNQYLQALKESAKIVDNRDKVIKRNGASTTTN
jgi:peptidyl-prolyl cis-trans isomerase D